MDKSSSRVRTMFSDIAPTYDLLNHLLSANQDIRWRRRAVRQICPRKGERILDLCCGTGDLSREISRQQPRCEVVGADFALPMLQIAQEKLEIPFVNADALRLPFQSESFDVVAVAFGVRNFEDTRVGLEEIRRVLKPNGRVLILEFLKLESGALRRFFGAFNVALSPIGRAVSGHDAAYSYLPQSVEDFYSRHEFAALLRETGFQNVRAMNFSGGIATAVLARR